MPTLRAHAEQFALAALVVTVTLWGATQWAASSLGNQPALGAPWVTILGWPLYAPWNLFAWWLTFDDQAPEVFATAGAIAALGGLMGGAVSAGGAAWRANTAKVVTTYGSARWAEASDVRRAGLTGDSGIVLGTRDNQYLRHDGQEHVMAIAPTRSGKGVGLVVPTLMTWTGSSVIHDIKGENWAVTSGWRSQFSHCLRFDPTDPHGVCFNPLQEVRKGPFEVRDAQNIADILVDPEGANQRRDHWERTGYSLLVGAILHVLYAEEEKTLSRVVTLLSDPSRPISRVLRVMMTTNHLGTKERPEVHPVVASVARELLNKAENERSGVVSTAMSYLSLYRDPIIKAVTSRSDWRISDLVTSEHPMSLYLVVPPSDISRTRPLMRLILNQIGRRLVESLSHVDGEARRHHLLLMLDEFPALGRLDFFETALAYLAGYDVRAFLVAQSLHQIDKAYGHNHAILDNCHVRVAFAPNDERTAKRLSEALGTATELRAQRNLSGKRFSPWLSHTSISSQETPRPLLTPGEILQLPADDALVLVSGTPPIRAKKLKYYQDQNFLARCLPAPILIVGAQVDAPTVRPATWTGPARSTDDRLDTTTSEPIPRPGQDPDDDGDDRPRQPQLPQRKSKAEREIGLPLFETANRQRDAEARDAQEPAPADTALGHVVQFPGVRV